MYIVSKNFNEVLKFEYHMVRIILINVHVYITIIINVYIIINYFIDTTRIWSSPYTGQLRLSGGNYTNEGLIEVYCNGAWGTVCDNTFSATAARIVCQQLGYNSYYRYNTLPM